jgi:hypothetical protein
MGLVIANGFLQVKSYQDGFGTYFQGNRSAFGECRPTQRSQNGTQKLMECMSWLASASMACRFNFQLVGVLGRAASFNSV